MEESWNRLKEWLAANWPEALDNLAAPATDSQIAALESQLGAKLPEDFVACLKVHNGQSNAFGDLFEGGEFLSTEGIMDQWNVWQDLLKAHTFDGIKSEPQPGIKNDWWNSRWIPFTYDGSGNHYCLDLDPAESGRSGQIITMWHDASERELLAPSFAQWFDDFVKGILSGQLVFSEDYGCIVPIEDL